MFGSPISSLTFSSHLSVLKSWHIRLLSKLEADGDVLVHPRWSRALKAGVMKDSLEARQGNTGEPATEEEDARMLVLVKDEATKELVD